MRIPKDYEEKASPDPDISKRYILICTLLVCRRSQVRFLFGSPFSLKSCGLWTLTLWHRALTINETFKMADVAAHLHAESVWRRQRSVMYRFQFPDGVFWFIWSLSSFSLESHRTLNRFKRGACSPKLHYGECLATLASRIGQAAKTK